MPARASRLHWAVLSRLVGNRFLAVDRRLNRMPMSDRSARRYAVIGTGGRSRMYVDALTSSHADLGEIVAFLDPNEARMAYYDRYLADRGHQAPPHFSPEQFEEMLTSTAPDVLIVTSKDSTHADHIVAGLDRRLAVITEKPRPIDVPRLERIAHAARDLQLPLLAAELHGAPADRRGRDRHGDLRALRVVAGHGARCGLLPPLAPGEGQLRRARRAQVHPPLRPGELVARGRPGDG